MGERTSALVSSRTAVPENRAINYSAALEERRAGNHSTSLPDVPILLHQPPLTVKSPDITELLAKHQHGEEMDKLVAQFVSKSVYVVPTLTEIEFRMPVRQEEGNDALLAQLVTKQTPAAAIMDQQSAANCCVCPPCNLLKALPLNDMTTLSWRGGAMKLVLASRPLYRVWPAGLRRWPVARDTLSSIIPPDHLAPHRFHDQRR